MAQGALGTMAGRDYLCGQGIYRVANIPGTSPRGCGSPDCLASLLLLVAKDVALARRNRVAMSHTGLVVSAQVAIAAGIRPLRARD